MTQPTPYNRTHAFTDTNLEAELDDIEVTLDGTLANLELIQRDDGQLRDETVEPHTLSSRTLSLIAAAYNPLGAWVTSTAYAVRDSVTNGGSFYICAVAHTSGTFATDLAAGKWMLVGNSAAVSSVHGRTGAVVAASGDYAATEVDNDSGVSGSSVAAALNTLDSGKQALNANLTALAGLSGAADLAPFFTASGTMSTMTVTSQARQLLNDSTAAVMRTTLGVPQLISHNTLCPHRNLAGLTNSVTSATFTADMLVLEDTSGNQLAISSFSKTAAITTSGLGGRDAGAEAANTWYHVWAIAKADGTQGIVLSTSTTVGGITFPSGYSYAGYIGAILNDSASDFQLFRQMGDEVTISQSQELTTGTSTVEATINLASCVPTTARRVKGHARVQDSASGVGQLTLRTVSGSTIGSILINSQGGTTSPAGGYFDLTMYTAQTIYYLVGTNDEANLFVTGFKF